MLLLAFLLKYYLILGISLTWYDLYGLGKRGIRDDAGDQRSTCQFLGPQGPLSGSGGSNNSGAGAVPARLAHCVNHTYCTCITFTVAKNSRKTDGPLKALWSTFEFLSELAIL